MKLRVKIVVAEESCQVEAGSVCFHNYISSGCEQQCGGGRQANIQLKCILKLPEMVMSHNFLAMAEKCEYIAGSIDRTDQWSAVVVVSFQFLKTTT